MTSLTDTHDISTATQTRNETSDTLTTSTGRLTEADAGASVGTESGTGAETQNVDDGSADFQGDGADSSQTGLLISQQSTLDWLAYSISLNFNRLATSIFSPITRWHWYDRVPNTRLVLGAVPSQPLLEQLQLEQNIEDVVNMCAEFQGHLQKMRELGLVQCWIPTRDFHTPSVQGIWTGVHFIAKCEANWQDLEDSKKGRIYLHCKAGRGRSATVALCWLVFSYKLTAHEAQVILLKARAQVDKNIYLHPEVTSFVDEVQEQERSNTIVRKIWPKVA